MKIRPIKTEEDLEEVMHIWLETNLKTHEFIEADYRKSNFEAVKEALLQAVNFYLREGFVITKEQEDKVTYEKEYIMKYES